MLVALYPLGCSRSEAPAPVATATVSVKAPSPVAPTYTPPPATVAPASVPGDLNDFSDSAEFEWNLADEAEDTDFEIDADATSYYMPQGNTVTLKAKALNGTPPFTFTWDFADGTPKVTGEMVKHIFNELGERDVIVAATDASGAKAFMHLGILVASVEDYAARMQLDPKVLDDYRAKYPAPTATP